MIVVSDSGPLSYLIEIGVEEILPRLYGRVLITPAVKSEMEHPHAPEVVRTWIGTPPAWLEEQMPTRLLSIPALTRKSGHHQGELEAISLAVEVEANDILLDDKTARREAAKFDITSVWLLSLLEQAAERGFIEDLTSKLEHLETGTTFRIGPRVAEIIEAMKSRDVKRRNRSPKKSP